jgi:hypothetical protein
MVGWMLRIYWPAVNANFYRITADFHSSLFPIMAGFAKGLELTGTEFHPVATMRFDVIDHCCRLD